MTSTRFAGIFLTAFVVLFFCYLLGPLVVMAVTAFNSSAFPRVAPFECFSVEWFGVLANDARLVDGLVNSVYISIGVVLLSVPIGMAGALLLTRLPDRAKPWYYTVAVSPILIPGVVLGISTLVFWDRLGRMFGAGDESVFYDGMFLTIAGQTTFVAAYCLLVFMARLQRFDATQEEAALDLGATPGQSFRKVLLPFLKPAIASSAVLAFLASFENYNTTVFTSLTQETLVTVLASKVRHGINPSIGALAVAIVALTLAGAVIYEILRRREAHTGAKAAAGRNVVSSKMDNPALALFLLVCVAGIGTVYFAGTVGVDECKATVQAEKRRRAQERIDALEKTLQGGAASAAPEAPANSGETIFAPRNLQPATPRPTDEAAPTQGESGQTNNPFSPDALAPNNDSPGGQTSGQTGD